MAILNIRTINSNINKIEKLEKDGHLETQLCKKISILECSGWIEEKMNDIIFCYIEKTVENRVLKEEIKKLTKKRRYGFKYKYFREKLSLVLSEVELISLERKIDNDDILGLDHFKNNLLSISHERDSLAHTYTRRYQSNNSSLIGYSNLKIKLNEINKVFKIIKMFMYKKY